MGKKTMFFVLFKVILLVSFCGGRKEAANLPYDTLESLTAERYVEPEATYVTPEPEKVEPAVEETVTETRVEPLTFATIRFEYDKYDLTPEAREVLAQHARTLQTNPLVRLVIEGHCDERGTIEYNLALGERRAVAVMSYLATYGIAPDRLSTISYGKERPVDNGHNETAWSLNRRADFRIQE